MVDMILNDKGQSHSF